VRGVMPLVEDLRDWLGWFGSGGWGEIWGRFSSGTAPHGKIIVNLPKWRQRSSWDVTEVVQKFGVELVFKQGIADLKDMALNSELYVGAWTQDAVVEVDEEGTKAAAVTKVEVGVTSAPSLLRFDHPFFYVIVHRPTGVWLFAGVYEDPLPPPSG